MKIKRKRINMRIPEDLIEFIKKFADEHSTTVTDDYIKYLEAKRSTTVSGAVDESCA